MFLLVGLGNPGEEYVGTVHNLGFEILDVFAFLCEIHFSSPRSKLKAQLCLTRLKCGSRILLAKPTTFMNDSGDAVQKIIRYYKISLENVFVVHDDIALNFGRIKLKKGGSSGGHNGIKSIDTQIGSDYWRIRFGAKDISSPITDLSNYVLSKVHYNKFRVAFYIKCLAKHLNLVFTSNKDALVQKYSKEIQETEQPSNS